MIMTYESPQGPVTLVAHDREGTPSPKEISRRILEVRASWDVQERIERRRDARDRFVQLMSRLDSSESRG